MKKNAVFLVIIACLVWGPAYGADDAPMGIAGFRLGENIDSIQDRIRKDTELPIRFAEYIHEVEIHPAKGFKSGLISFGTCALPGRIVRIKLKFADASPEFYEKLLERYKKTFGDPNEWRGDPFHVVIAWKWSFTDKEGNPVSLILQHNTKDTEEKMGNSVKLAIHNFIESERACFIEKNPDFRKSAKGNPRSANAPEWDNCIPR